MACDKFLLTFTRRDRFVAVAFRPTD